MNNSNGFKMTEIGILPKDWESANLEEVSAKMKAGGTPKTGVKEYWNGGIPLVKVEDVVRSDKYLSSTNLSITEKGLEKSSAWLVPENSVILTMYGTPGEVCLNKMPVAVTQNVMGIVKENMITTDFLYYALKYAKKYTLSKIADRTIFTHFSLAKAKRLSFPLPPLPEQQKISSVLSAVQEAKEKTENVINALKELKKSMMKHLFTYGPVPVKSPLSRGDLGVCKAEEKETHPRPLLLEGRQPTLKETEIGMIPEHWEVKTIREVCEKVIDCPHSTPKFIESGVLCVRNFNLRNGRLILNKPFFTSEEEYKERVRRCEPIEGDVLFSREAPIGEACLIPSQTKLSLGQRMMLLRTDPLKLNNFYLVQTFYSKGIRKLMNEISSGVTAKHLNVADVRHLPIPLPPLTEQQGIAQMIYNIDKKMEAEENKKQALEALFKTLLSLLMTGKMRVKDLDV